MNSLFLSTLPSVCPRLLPYDFSAIRTRRAPGTRHNRTALPRQVLRGDCDQTRRSTSRDTPLKRLRPGGPSPARPSQLSVSTGAPVTLSPALPAAAVSEALSARRQAASQAASCRVWRDSVRKRASSCGRRGAAASARRPSARCPAAAAAPRPVFLQPCGGAGTPSYGDGTPRICENDTGIEGCCADQLMNEAVR